MRIDLNTRTMVNQQKNQYFKNRKRRSKSNSIDGKLYVNYGLHISCESPKKLTSPDSVEICGWDIEFLQQIFGGE